ncbi:carbohydrate ABC transporter permease [Bacillus sp. FJAT-50079]|uniref:carbohydrate ABC transporter permease n=1 Tax=Bacillus sp. FJAT-50079 TaxID=2833577 RepID=UPI001BC8D7E7|nr:carbohydrate ABC transporter permease [Bacillus sp. FJAT-50079]MBS4210027.1 carbohydrate ABC transporter permease [Bacillus sp. FJAT-50079]
MIQKWRGIPTYIIAIIFLLFTGLPFFFMINTAFKDQFEFLQSPWKLPASLNIENFTNILNGTFFTYFMNSIIVSVSTVILVVIFASLASYPLARIKFKLSKPVFMLFLVGMMIPVHSTLIPIYVLTQKLGLYNSLWGLLGPYIAFALPVSIVIFVQFMKEIPNELIEAARIDGCGHFSIFWVILFPLLTPAISTVFIYNFIHTWNEFIFALILLQSEKSMTLPLGLREFYGEFSVNIPGMMAALTLASLPLLIVYFIGQEKVVKGLSAGSVKG